MTTTTDIGDKIRRLSLDLGEDFYEWIVAIASFSIGINALAHFYEENGIEKAQDLVVMTITNLVGLKKGDDTSKIDHLLEDLRAQSIETFRRNLERVMESNGKTSYLKRPKRNTENES